MLIGKKKPIKKAVFPIHYVKCNCLILFYSNMNNSKQMYMYKCINIHNLTMNNEK